MGYICQGPCHGACLAAWLEDYVRQPDVLELPGRSLISCGSGWVNYYLGWASWTAEHNLGAISPGPDLDGYCEMEGTEDLVYQAS
jgi:hypothetical protein